MNKALLSIVVLVGVTLPACGGDGQADPARSGTPAAATAENGQTAAAGASRYKREDVIAALGVTRGRDENGVWNSDLRTGCFASKIFVSPADNMAAYIQIGDPVATNPSGAVGVTIGTYRGVSASKCLRIFKRRLAKLK
jgi:hypothetical protein